MRYVIIPARVIVVIAGTTSPVQYLVEDDAAMHHVISACGSSKFMNTKYKYQLILCPPSLQEEGPRKTSGRTST